MQAIDLILAEATNTCLVFTKSHATCIHDYQLNIFDLAKATNACLVFTKTHATCIHNYQLNRFDLLILVLCVDDLILISD